MEDGSYTRIKPPEDWEEKLKLRKKKFSYKDTLREGLLRKSLLRTSSVPLEEKKEKRDLVRSSSGGASRISYDRNFLLSLRSSSLSSLPPPNLPQIPGATIPKKKKKSKKNRVIEKTFSNASVTSVTSEDTIPDVEIDRICKLAANTTLTEVK